MIKPLLSYVKTGLLPRLGRILFQPQVLLSVVIGASCFHWGPSLAAAQLKASDVGGMILTYAAIAFGFCITGMALVLTLPSDRFLKTLQNHKSDTKGQSSYLDLLFVFSWTAVCHWLLVVSAIAAILMRGTVRSLDHFGRLRVASIRFLVCRNMRLQPHPISYDRYHAFTSWRAVFQRTGRGHPASEIVGSSKLIASRTKDRHYRGRSRSGQVVWEACGARNY